MDAATPRETLRERERALRRALEIVTGDMDFSRQLDALLELGSETLGTDYATLSRVDADAGQYVFERVAVPPDADLEPGEVTPLETLPNCARVVETEETLVLADVSVQAPELSDPTWDVRCYLGAPVTVDGAVHGTFCFFDTAPRSEAFADWEVEFVETLAAWASNALAVQRYLDRVARRTEVGAVVRETVAAALEADSREGIEAAVCRSLAAADAYRAAWIGVADPDADDLTVRAAAGRDADDPDAAIPLGTSGTHAAPPALALETGDVHVSRAADDPRAVLSVPVSYEGVVQCVLTVHANRRDAFEGEERSILGHLGDAVGHAIAAMEGRRVLADDRVIELTLRIRHALADTDPERTPNVVVDDLVQAEAGVLTGYVTVDPGDVEPIERLAEAHPRLAGVSTVATHDAAVDVELRVRNEGVIAAVLSRGGSIDALAIDGEDLRLRLLLPTTVDARHIVETARTAAAETDVVSKREVTRTEATVDRQALLGDLTDRQLAALRAAYFAGYYERPRETDGAAVAETLGIAGATFSQHRRAAENKLLGRLFEDGPE